MTRRILLFLLVACLPLRGLAEEGLVFIGNSALPKTDLASLQRLYTGRVVSLGDQQATPVNLPAGHPLRERFLSMVMGQNEEQYTGYWLVRRYVGKGTPPKELADVDAILSYVQATPGAVAYVPLSKVPAGANVIFRR